MASQYTRDKILKRMLEYSAGGDLAVCVSRLKGERTSTFRYCDECLKEWIESHQAPYWRLDHQLAGVYCCARHSCVLKAVRNVAGCCVDQTVTHCIRDSDDAVLHTLAPTEKRAIEDISRRSVQQRADGKLGKSAKEYQDLLKEAGLFRENAQLNHTKSISAWFQFFGKEYCHLTNTNSNRIAVWLQHISQGVWNSRCPHPFMFIAGESLLTYLAGLPGSHIPRKCLKKQHISGEEKVPEPVIETYSCKGSLHRISDTLKITLNRKGGWKLVCTCGLSYRMVKGVEGGVETLTPMSYGTRYRKRLFSLIDKGMSACAAARELRVAHTCACMWENGRNGGDIKPLPKVEVRKLRAKWCRLVRNTVSKKRITSAMQVDPATYESLLKFDRVWLRAFNLHHRSPPRADTSSPDEPTGDEIREAQRQLILVEPPVMASRSAILRKLGYVRACNRSRPYFGVLAKTTERRPDYLERVISWLASLANQQRLGDCDEALRSAGLGRRGFNAEQRERIREIELMNKRGDQSQKR